MLVISMSEFASNPSAYENKPFFGLEVDGKRWIVRPARKNFFARLFAKRKPQFTDEFIDAINEAEELERNPNTKRYTDMDQMWADLDK